jgi:hypothetical protein
MIRQKDLCLTVKGTSDGIGCGWAKDGTLYLWTRDGAIYLPAPHVAAIGEMLIKAKKTRRRGSWAFLGKDKK